VLTGLSELDLQGCGALHTPPPSSVRAGVDAILQFLRDLAKGEAPSHLIKVVLLGEQRAGKSSLADSLVLGRPATRADNDRTVGIEVRRWRLGGHSQVVANIYDAAGQRVYRATHGFFMSAGALFLHVVRCDMTEDAAVAVLLEWVEAVQQEAPGAVMSLVWTHSDFFANDAFGGDGGHLGFLCVTGRAYGETESWIAMCYLQQETGVSCAFQDVPIVYCGSLDIDAYTFSLKQHVETEDVQGKVALFDDSNFEFRYLARHGISRLCLDLQSRGAVGVIIIIDDCRYDNTVDGTAILSTLLSSGCAAACLPIMLILEGDAHILAHPGAKITAYPGLLLPFCPATCLYVPDSCA